MNSPEEAGRGGAWGGEGAGPAGTQLGLTASPGAAGSCGPLRTQPRHGLKPEVLPFGMVRPASPNR